MRLGPEDRNTIFSFFFLPGKQSGNRLHSTDRPLVCVCVCAYIHKYIDGVSQSQKKPGNLDNFPRRVLKCNANSRLIRGIFNVHSSPRWNGLWTWTDGRCGYYHHLHSFVTSSVTKPRGSNPNPVYGGKCKKFSVETLYTGISYQIYHRRIPARAILIHSRLLSELTYLTEVQTDGHVHGVPEDTVFHATEWKFLFNVL